MAALERALARRRANWLRAELQSQVIRLHQRYHRVVKLENALEKVAPLTIRGTSPRSSSIL